MRTEFNALVKAASVALIRLKDGIEVVKKRKEDYEEAITACGVARDIANRLATELTQLVIKCAEEGVNLLEDK